MGSLTDPVTTASRTLRDKMAISVSDTSPPSHAGLSWKDPAALAEYISGYTDGEGCFSVSIWRRPRLYVGWEARPSFSVCQKQGKGNVLKLIRDYFGCGSIRPSSTDGTDHYETRSVHDLIAKIIPHFERYPMLSTKQQDFERFKEICGIVATGAHLRVSGLRQILQHTLLMTYLSPKRKKKLWTLSQLSPKRIKV